MPKIPLLWPQKLCKARRNIISIEVLSKKFSSSCILELICLKNYANQLINLLIAHTNSNAAEHSATLKPQHFFLANIATPSTR